MRVYQTKADVLNGTDFYEVRAAAMEIFRKIKRRSRRQPYVRSAYFKKSKVFLNLFWQHLFDKDNWKERMRRKSEILHRFTGLTREGDLFYVQIKENILNKKKLLMSIFPKVTAHRV